MEVEKSQYGGSDLRESITPPGPHGLNAGDIVEIIGGERSGEKGILRFRSGLGRAIVGFADGTSMTLEPSQYASTLPEVRFGTALRDALIKALGESVSLG